MLLILFQHLWSRVLLSFKILINEFSRNAEIRQDNKNHYLNKYPNNIFKNVLPEYMGHVERGKLSKTSSNSRWKKIQKKTLMAIMQEIEDWIYTQRPID